MIAGLAHLVLASAIGPPLAALPRATTALAVPTYHNDNLRTGWSARETVLTQASVASGKFGILKQLALDGDVEAQPLYLSGVKIGPAKHNVVFVATEHDSVYAFDADTFAPLWQKSFSVPALGIGPEPTSDTKCGVIRPWIGISSTPAIDVISGTLYVVDKTVAIGGPAPVFNHSLHALALDTGADRMPPVAIAGSVLLSDKSTLTFDPKSTTNRAGILLSRGNVYVAFTAMCDGPPLPGHGWVFAYRAADLSQTGIFATTTDVNTTEYRGSIWQSTYGIAGDENGSVYCVTSNGAFDAYPAGKNYGDSVLRLGIGLPVEDYFTPFGEATLDKRDLDFGAGGVMLLPKQPGAVPHLAVAAGKATAIYLLNRDNLGKFTPGGPDKVLQAIPFFGYGSFGGPAYFADTTGTYVYYALQGSPLVAYRLTTSPSPKLTASSRSANAFPGIGGTIPAVSSNGSTPGTAIVWATTRPDPSTTNPIQLYAYDADNLAHVLFTGTVGPWTYPKGSPFLTPTIAGGKVFVGGQTALTIFGAIPLRR